MKEARSGTAGGGGENENPKKVRYPEGGVGNYFGDIDRQRNLCEIPFQGLLCFFGNGERGVSNPMFPSGLC